jgi:hypothetical protein
MKKIVNNFINNFLLCIIVALISAFITLSIFYYLFGTSYYLETPVSNTIILIFLALLESTIISSLCQYPPLIHITKNIKSFIIWFFIVSLLATIYFYTINILGAEIQKTEIQTYIPSNEEIEMLAKTVWGEARGCSDEEQRLVIWTIFQRLDSEIWIGDTIEAIITRQGQFTGYRSYHPIDENILKICEEELQKWIDGEEAPTHEIYAPQLPYYKFSGSSGHNWFK